MVASDPHKREVSLTPTFQHILEHPVHYHYQHWAATLETRDRYHLEAGGLDFYAATKATHEPRCPGFETSVSTQMR